MEWGEVEIARHLCDLLPTRVQVRLLDDQSFTAQYGPLARPVLTIGEISLDQAELFSATRRTLAAPQDQYIEDLAGRKVQIALGNDTVILRVIGDREPVQQVEIPHLMILSPKREHRIGALNHAIEKIGPTAPDFSLLKMAAEERELSDEEFISLLKEISSGFEAHRARVTSAHSANSIKIDDIVPDVMSYYESFCGPDPRLVEPEEYITKTLPTYRKELLKKSLVKGLEICLLGALRDDLMPTTWTDDVSHDDMWNALAAIDVRGNPFSLLGVLDIALARQDDERYRNMASNTMTVLLQEQLLRPDGVDGYEILSLFSQLVLGRINILEGGALRKPFWKRMCAWMHGGLLMQSTLNIRINLPAMRQWVNSNRSIGGAYAQTLDLRREPMYRAGEISPCFIREEIIGRLVILRARHQAAGHSVPQSDGIDAAMANLSRKGSPLGWAMPGPLDGHIRPADHKGRALSEKDVSHIMERLSKDPYGAIWSELAYFSQYFDLGNEILGRACEASAKLALNVEILETQTKLGRLLDVGIVAAAQRSKDLARSISTTALARAPHASSANDSIEILEVLLLSSAAFESEVEWHTWVEDQLASLAYRLPQGEATQSLFEHLKEIKKVLPISLSIGSRAEAIASAAN